MLEDHPIAVESKRFRTTVTSTTLDRFKKKVKALAQKWTTSSLVKFEWKLSGFRSPGEIPASGDASGGSGPINTTCHTAPDNESHSKDDIHREFQQQPSGEFIPPKEDVPSTIVHATSTLTRPLIEQQPPEVSLSPLANASIDILPPPSPPDYRGTSVHAEKGSGDDKLPAPSDPAPRKRRSVKPLAREYTFFYFEDSGKTVYPADTPDEQVVPYSLDPADKHVAAKALLERRRMKASLNQNSSRTQDAPQTTNAADSTKKIYPFSTRPSDQHVTRKHTRRIPRSSKEGTSGVSLKEKIAAQRNRTVRLLDHETSVPILSRTSHHEQAMLPELVSAVQSGVGVDARLIREEIAARNAAMAMAGRLRNLKRQRRDDSDEDADSLHAQPASPNRSKKQRTRGYRSE